MGKKEDLQNQINDVQTQLNNATDPNEKQRLQQQLDQLKQEQGK